MNKEFVPYEESLTLKELGFDEPCIAFYYNKTKFLKLGDNPDYLINKRKASYVFGNEEYDVTLAPLYQQAFRWFREKYNLRGFIGFRPNVKQFDCHIYDMSLSGKEYVKQRTMEEFNKDPKVGTYEEAELECLKKLIEIVKNNE
jgi:hypothetical protein